MAQSISDTIDTTLGRLTARNKAFSTSYPGESGARQPLHTVYGGAQLYKAETTSRLGELAIRHLNAYAPDAGSFARALKLPGHSQLPTGEGAAERFQKVTADPVGTKKSDPHVWFAQTVYERVTAKLKREPVEDFRIDFEDGFGTRPDAEEDETAERAAKELARAMREGIAPPFIGIRIKPFNEELKRRGARTLDIFVTTLLAETGGKLPQNFVVTLPKVPVPEQVEALVELLAALESANGLEEGSLKLELMIELTQTLFDNEGRAMMPQLHKAAQGRMVAAHFGTYDYTASANITAAHQVMDHQACDFAKHMMMVAFGGTGILLSDGATNVMPVGPHRGEDMSAAQQEENARVVHAAWRTAYDHIQHSLVGGFYQGWDLHPGQLPVRYAACFTFFLRGLDAASERLSNFIDKAAQATLVGDVFDDAATGQGLLNYFLRAYNSGAITLDDVTKTGLTLEEIQQKSFVKVLANRRHI